MEPQSVKNWNKVFIVSKPIVFKIKVFLANYMWVRLE